MTETFDIRIDVIPDRAGVAAVDASLTPIEEKAKRIRTAMSKATAIDPTAAQAGSRAAQAALAEVQRSTVATKQSTDQLKTSFEGIFARTGGSAQAVSAQTQLQTALAGTQKAAFLTDKEIDALMGPPPTAATTAVRGLGEEAVKTTARFQQLKAAEAGAFGTGSLGIDTSALQRYRAALLDVQRAREAASRTVAGTTGGDAIVKPTVDRASAQNALNSALVGGAASAQQNARSMKDLADAQDRTRASTSGLGSALRSTFAFLGVTILARNVLGLADAYTNLQNKLRTVTNGQEELASATKTLFSIANETRVAVSAVGSVYTRVGSSAKELGLSQKGLADFTRSLSQAVSLSGASATEANNALIQLSQGMAAGALRGDELRSVLEQLPTVADIIAKGLGVTRGQLRKLGEDGQISAAVILDAFKKAAPELEKQFAKSIPTIGQAFQVLRNNILQFVGESATASGASEKVAKAILFVSQNVETLIRSIVALSTVMAVNFATTAISKTIAALSALGRAVLTNPLTALPGIIAVAIGAIVAFGDQISIGGDSLANLQDVAVAAFQVISEAVGPAIDAVQEFLTEIGVLSEGFDLSFRGIALSAASAIDAVVGVFAGGYNVILAIFGTLPSRFADFGELALLGVRNLTEAAIDFVLAAFQTLGGIIRNTGVLVSSIVIDSANAIRFAATANLEAAQDAADRALESGKRIVTQFGELPKQFKRNLDALKGTDILPVVEISQEAQELGTIIAEEFQRGFQSAEGATEVVNRIFARAEELAKQRAEAASKTPASGGAPSGGVSTFAPKQTASTLTKGELDAINQVKGPMIEYEQRLRDIDSVKRAGIITSEEAAAATDAATIAALQGATSIEAGYTRAFAKLRQEARDFASVIEAALNVVVNRVVDAITTLLETGKFQFKSFAYELLKELSRIFLRALIVLAITSAIGGGAQPVITPAAQGIAGIVSGYGEQPQRAGGGGVEPSRGPYLVGERGPELFTPEQKGSITPASQTGAGAGEPPQINLHVTNVTDPEDIPRAINTGKYDQVILNVLARNKTATKRYAT